MSSIIEQQYIMDISTQLERFRVIEPNRIYNFRCNICGDSQDNELKARGYFFHATDDDIYMQKCHNCGASFSFQHYLKLYFPEEYKQLRADIFKSRNILRPKQPEPVKKSFKVDEIFSKDYQEALKSIIETTKEVEILTPIDSLSDSHPAKEYLLQRGMNQKALERLFYTEDFNEFARSVIPDELIGLRKIPNDSRIVLLLKSLNGEILGIQGRALDPNSKLRYMTLMMAETHPKFFGLEHINKETDIFVTEGAMDSFFLPNAMSVNGGDTKALNDIIEGDSIDRDKFIIVLDNEPRSKDLYKRLKKTIEDGFRVIIWEGISPEYKDINDMIKNSVFASEESLVEYLLNNVHSGTTALLKLKFWSKI